MRKHRRFGEIEEEYFVKHPDEIDDYLTIIFEEYARDRDAGALLSSLRRVSRAKGISEISRESGLTRNGIQKALSKEGSPKFESIVAILSAMGYRLKPEKLAAS